MMENASRFKITDDVPLKSHLASKRDVQGVGVLREDTLCHVSCREVRGHWSSPSEGRTQVVTGNSPNIASRAAGGG